MLLKVLLDTSALCACWETGLLDNLARTGQPIYTPSSAFINAGLNVIRETNISAGIRYLKILSLTDHQYYKVIGLSKQYTNITIADCDALIQASDNGYTLLTSDKTIRIMAASMRISTISFHALIKQLINQNVIHESVALDYYISLSNSFGNLTNFEKTDPLQNEGLTLSTVPDTTLSLQNTFTLIKHKRDE